MCTLQADPAGCLYLPDSAFACRLPPPRMPVMAECKAKAKAELFIFCAETFKREISLHGLAAQVLPDVCVYTLHICIEFSC